MFVILSAEGEREAEAARPGCQEGGARLRLRPERHGGGRGGGLPRAGRGAGVAGSRRCRGGGLAGARAGAQPDTPAGAPQASPCALPAFMVILTVWKAGLGGADCNSCYTPSSLAQHLWRCGVMVPLGPLCCLQGGLQHANCWQGCSLLSRLRTLDRQQSLSTGTGNCWWHGCYLASEVHSNL